MSTNISTRAATLVEVLHPGPTHGDWRGRFGWALVDFADKLYDIAHKVTRGDTPASDAFTISHLERISKATGMPPSDMVRMIQERGTVEHLR